MHYIEHVYSLHGQIPLSMTMKDKVSMALIVIIEDEIERLKKQMIDRISSNIEGANKLA